MILIYWSVCYIGNYNKMDCLLLLVVLISKTSVIGVTAAKKDCKIVELNEEDYDDIHHMMKTFNTFLANNVETNKKLMEAINKGNQISESNGNHFRNLNTIYKTNNDSFREIREEIFESAKLIRESTESMKLALAEMSEVSRQNFMTLFDAIADLQGEARKPKKISRKKTIPDSKENKDVQSDMLSLIMKNINEMKSEMVLQKQILNDVQLAVNKKPFDCSDILREGKTLGNGVYTIYAFGDQAKPVKAFCDMETNGGGWTVFLSRQQQNEQENFTRIWQEYKMGFGNTSAEYWLGNEVLHQMTNKRNYSLRIEGKAEGLKDTWGEFNKFKIYSEESKYKIKFDEGTDGTLDFEAWSYHNDLEFSTYDQDNDGGSWHCAKDWKSGWWFQAKCYEFLLTGVLGAKDGTGLVFGSWSKEDPHFGFPNFVQMKIRPVK